MDDIALRVEQCAREERLPSGGVVRVLCQAAEVWLAQDLRITRREVQIAALLKGVMPLRYLRNQGSLRVEDQLTLLGSHVAMVGLGGLGGHVLELLARTGVGRIRAADMDIFEEHNLNRQFLATGATLGMPKAEAALLRAREINPAASVETTREFLTDKTMRTFLTGARLAMDCLGGLASRLALQRAASEAGVPLVTGALAGLTGYVAVVEPGKPGPAEFLGQGRSDEETLGTPAQSVALVATLMAAEAVRLLTGKPSPLVGGMLLIDLGEMRFERVSLG